jgi:hypothetical protein
LVFIFALEYTTGKAHESKGGLKLNETYQFGVCDNVNLLGENINTVKKKETNLLLDASK